MAESTRFRLFAWLMVFGPSIGKATGYLPGADITACIIIAAVLFSTAAILRRLEAMASPAGDCP